MIDGIKIDWKLRIESPPLTVLSSSILSSRFSWFALVIVVSTLKPLLRGGTYAFRLSAPGNMGQMPGIDPLRSLDLVWTLRNINAKRTHLLPVDPDHQRELIDLGLVELRDDVPVITNAGHQS